MAATSTFVIIAAVFFMAPASRGDCPPVIKSAVEKAYPGAKNPSCKQEMQGGKDIYEVKLTTKAGGKAEMDMAPDGTVLQVEEQMSLDTVPSAVLKAFKDKYPGANVSVAVKQTRADGKVFFEIAFEAGGAKKEATFAAGGAFVEEE